MRTFRRNRSLIFILIGGLLMGTSGLWEYSRMAPDYRFLVDPWSLRGFETTQGGVVAALAIALVVLAFLIAYGVIRETWLGAIVATAVVTGAGVLIAIWSDPRDVQLGGLALVGLAAIGGFAATAVVRHFLPTSLDRRMRRGALLGSWIAGYLIAQLAILGPIFSDSTQPLWTVVLVGFLFSGFSVVFRSPRELAAHRLLINGALVSLVVVLTMGGSLRSQIASEQLANPDLGVAAELRDIQITSGVIVSWLGALLLLVGVIALWAKRRDQLEAKDRARKQLEAALRSADELGEEDVEIRVEAEA